MNAFSETIKQEEKMSANLSCGYDETVLIPMTSVQLEIHIKNRLSHTIELGQNIVTQQGKANMAHLLAGNDVANREVSEMRFGDAGHNPLDPTSPLATDSSDIDLFGNTIISKQVSVEFPDGTEGGRVSFVATISESEANGPGSQAISEVGLFDTTGRMISHKTFGLFTKSAAFGIVARYSFQF